VKTTPRDDRGKARQKGRRLDRMGAANRASWRRAAALPVIKLEFRVRARTVHVQQVAEPDAWLVGAGSNSASRNARRLQFAAGIFRTRPGMWYAIEGYDGEDVLARRQQARPQHLARLNALRDTGRLLLAGPCPAIDCEDPGPAGFSGSIVIAGFDSLEQARAWAQDDPYVEAGVYQRVEVRPFKAVLP